MKNQKTEKPLISTNAIGQTKSQNPNSNQSDPVGYFYVTGTILLVVYGQLAIKSQLAGMELPAAIFPKLIFLFQQLFNPIVFSGFVAAFLAGLCWMAAMTKLPISRAYPLMSLAFALVIFASWLIFVEPLSVTKIIGGLLLIPSLLLIQK